jgi:hypothetical protein
MVTGRFIDLDSEFIEIGVPTFGKKPQDEFWQNDLRATDGLYSFRLPSCVVASNAALENSYGI